MPSERSAQPRVLLIGFGPTSLSALDSLAERLEVVGLVREYDPDAPEADETVRRARTLGVPVHSESSLTAVERLIDRLVPDCVVVTSYSRVLPARIVAKSRFVNVHYALLPQYRGRANVNWAIINGEQHTGISIHVISPELDAGNILFQEAVAIGPHDTVTDLYNRLNALQREHLADAVRGFLRGEPGTPQAQTQATYCCTRVPEDGEIDWAAPAQRVHDLIRALTPPYPGAFTYFEGRLLRIWRAEVPADTPRYVGRVPGRIAAVSKAKGFIDVLAGDGAVRVYEVQLPGEAPRPAPEVISTLRATLGVRVSDLLSRIRHLEERLISSGQEKLVGW